MSEALPRVLPHNLEAEKAVLACLLSGEQQLVQVLPLLKTPEVFYEPRHALIFDAILSLQAQQKAIDILTVFNLLEERQQGQMVGGRLYLSELLSQPIVLQHAVEYAKTVLNKFRLRQLHKNLQKVVEQCLLPDAEWKELLNLATAVVQAFKDEEGQKGLEAIKHILDAKIADLLSGGEHSKPLPSGFQNLDRAIGGFGKGTLTILAARPGMGKSAFALNIASLAAIEGSKSVAIFSLEMTKEEIASRLLAAKSNVEAHLLQQSLPQDSPKWRQLGEGYAQLSRSRLYVDDHSGLTPLDLLSKCRQLKLAHGLDLVIVDYLQLMQGNQRRNDNRQQEISEISRALKLLAKDLEIPVIALSQLSRSCESRENKRPLMSDLRESGSLEQDADIVLFLYRDDYYKKEEMPREVQESELIISKNRSGSTGMVKLGWYPKYTKFFDLGLQEVEQPTDPYLGVQVQEPPYPMEEPYPPYPAAEADFLPF